MSGEEGLHLLTPRLSSLPIELRCIPDILPASGARATLETETDLQYKSSKPSPRNLHQFIAPGSTPPDAHFLLRRDTALSSEISNQTPTPIQLSWKNISFFVNTSKGTQELIHRISGIAEPGQVLAVMGCSGAGKTTLLNVLSGRLARKARVSGSVQANGEDITAFNFRSYLGYVMQEDILLDTLSPRECLTFAANIRLQGTQAFKTSRVEKMLEDFKLSEVADNSIGSIMERGLSGGERRRVAIAVELIMDPSILFLDGIP